MWQQLLLQERDVAETSTETSTDDLHVFGMRAAEQLAQSLAAIAHAQGRFLEELFSDSSEQKAISDRQQYNWIQPILVKGT